jgi:hypothetical protein
MPLARLAQYQHCLLRRNGVRTHWSNNSSGSTGLRDQVANLRRQWCGPLELRGSSSIQNAFFSIGRPYTEDTL